MKYEIRVDNHDQSFSCGEKESLLTAARQTGIPIPLGCDNGGCGMCKIKAVEGSSEIGLCSKSVLTEEERGEGYRLACRTYPKSNLVISLLKESF